MNKEYAIYPFRYMNITQRHDQGNHVPHWQGSTNYSDKPWDEGCQDGGRSYFEPKNDFVIEQVLGLNTATTNSVRLRSVNKLYIPYKAEPDYLYVTLTHMNEDNLRQVHEGQILKAGTRILLEGTDGYATGNHFHITANIGRYYGLLQNSNGKWCYTYDKSLLPHEAFWVDNDFTTILNNRAYPFLAVIKEEPKAEEPTPVEPEKPVEAPPVEENTQDNTNTLDDPKTSENEQENDKKGHGFINFLSSLVKAVVDLLKKIFKVG